MTLTIEAAKDKVEFEPIIDNLPLAIIVVNRDRRVVLANQMAALFANKSKKEFFGLYGGEAFGCVNSNKVPKGCGFAPECEFCTVKNTVLDTFDKKSDRARVDAELTFFGLGKRNLKVSTTYIELKTGDLVILAMEDVTEEKTKEALRLENEKLQSAIETGGAVCHEMNQPLLVVSLVSEILMKEHNEDGSLHQNLKTIKDQIDRMGEITGKLMKVTQYKTKSYLKGQILDIDEVSI